MMMNIKASAPVLLNDIEFLHYLESRSLPLLLKFIEWEKEVGKKTVYIEHSNDHHHYYEKISAFTKEYQQLHKHQIFL